MSLPADSLCVYTPTYPPTMFSVGFLIQAILATAAFAVPSNKERLSERVARRGAAHQSKPLNRITPQVNTDVELSSNDVISSNWGGAVLVADEVSTAVSSSTGGTHNSTNRLPTSPLLVHSPFLTLRVTVTPSWNVWPSGLVSTVILVPVLFCKLVSICVSPMTK